mmetsp:Transcript_80315/g.233228  ORF Transcript_80315/g.233228 Transcript_80315/m.233228 type:complete len:203 (+) Transcript_80315:154-762(+)|eukprot:CAMPEP_0176011880 /NCGR_PEP_ID=MMETSP0120_2-20121206/5509_1 /TAXON_ID=160619 /ORGANISM="Kryptoperidinium foliaceum, Strain CCMP 1326" /LENGTH=202 /DNA_ID=CAMNT_0017344751 /DNA_START=149 /DNA_END=757 /DNA_ORIENTATION=+
MSEEMDRSERRIIKKVEKANEEESGGQIDKDLETADAAISTGTVAEGPAFQADTSSRGTAAASDPPQLFYCPLSKEIFKNPVVAANGETYEKAVYLKEHDLPQECESAKKLYPNRALKMIMDDAALSQSSSIQASFKRLRYTVKRAMSEYLEPQDDDTEDGTSRGNPDVGFPLSDGFYCGITYNIMHEPVIDPDGNNSRKLQ